MQPGVCLGGEVWIGICMSACSAAASACGADYLCVRVHAKGRWPQYGVPWAPCEPMGCEHACSGGRCDHLSPGQVRQGAGRLGRNVQAWQLVGLSLRQPGLVLPVQPGNVGHAPLARSSQLADGLPQLHPARACQAVGFSVLSNETLSAGPPFAHRAFCWFDPSPSSDQQHGLLRVGSLLMVSHTCSTLACISPSSCMRKSPV